METKIRKEAEGDGYEDAADFILRLAAVRGMASLCAAPCFASDLMLEAWNCSIGETVRIPAA